MAGNNKQKNRMSIEAAINNDIQIVQQKDSQLTYQWIKNNDDPDVACKNPGSYLAEWINNENKFVQTIPENSDRIENRLFTRMVTGKSINSSGGPKQLTQVKYSFNTLKNQTNKRIV